MQENFKLAQFETPIVQIPDENNEIFIKRNDSQVDIVYTELLTFLTKIDRLFPVPLSKKESLATLASKLKTYGTISIIRDQDKIVSMCAGYTNNLRNKLGYISVVATLPEYSGKGYGKRAVQDFIENAKKAGMSEVHLYADSGNCKALHMYEKLGFSVWNIPDEPRPEDKHLIIRL